MWGKEGGQAHLEQARPTQRDRWPVALVLFPLWFSNSPCRLCIRPTNTQTFSSRSKRWLLSLARRRRGGICMWWTDKVYERKEEGAALEAEQVFKKGLLQERREDMRSWEGMERGVISLEYMEVRSRCCSNKRASLGERQGEAWHSPLCVSLHCRVLLGSLMLMMAIHSCNGWVGPIFCLPSFHIHTVHISFVTKYQLR